MALVCRDISPSRSRFACVMARRTPSSWAIWIGITGHLCPHSLCSLSAVACVVAVGGCAGMCAHMCASTSRRICSAACAALQSFACAALRPALQFPNGNAPKPDISVGRGGGYLGTPPCRAGRQRLCLGTVGNTICQYCFIFTNKTKQL